MPAKITSGHLFKGIPKQLGKEVSQILLKRPGLSILRIVSQGQTTDWLTQGFDEWVVLLSGAASLLFGDQGRKMDMKPGDYAFIPAGCRHRVVWTDSARRSVWLAVHYKGERAARRPGRKNTR